MIFKAARFSFRLPTTTSCKATRSPPRRTMSACAISSARRPAPTTASSTATSSTTARDEPSARPYSHDLAGPDPKGRDRRLDRSSAPWRLRWSDVVASSHGYSAPPPTSTKAPSLKRKTPPSSGGVSLRCPPLNVAAVHGAGRSAGGRETTRRCGFGWLRKLTPRSPRAGCSPTSFAA